MDHKLELKNDVVTIKFNDSYRIFRTQLPKKINLYRFGNVKNMLMSKLIENDYSRQIIETQLHLGFMWNNTKYDCHYVLILEEDFDEINIDEINIDDIYIPEHLKSYFASLQNQINNLNLKIFQLNEKIKN